MPPSLNPLDLVKGAAALTARILGQDRAPAPDEATPPPPESGRTGKYDEPLVALVAGQPGITVAEAAARLDVHPTSLYPVIRRLESRRRLAKVGRGLHVPAAAPDEHTEQLWCEAGHLWQRPTVRGRKPRRCPEHR